MTAVEPWGAHDAEVAAICRRAAELVGPARDVDVQLWVLDADGEHLDPVARFPVAEPPAAMPFVDLDPEATRALVTGPNVRAEGGALPPRWGLGQAGPVLLVPLRRDDRPAGVLVVAIAAGQPPLGATHERALTSLARRAALEVDHARLVAGTAGSNRRQAELRVIGRHALAAQHAVDLEQRVVEHVRTALDADGALLFRVLADGVTGVVVAGTGLPPTYPIGRSFPISPRTKEAMASPDPGPWSVDTGSVGYGNSLSIDLGFAVAGATVVRPRHGHPLLLGVGRHTPRLFAGPERRFLEHAADLLTAGLDIRETHARLQREATTDGLTGLPNRASLQRHLHDAIGRAATDGTSVSLLLADLDGFKLVNDSLGHAEGDHLLRAVSLRLSTVVRPDDVVARLGGDEFAVLCTGADELGAVAVAERALRALAVPVELTGRRVTPRASIGIAVHDPGSSTGGASADELLQRADAAMYRAKAGGGHRVGVYDVVVDEQVRRRLAVEQGLRAAVRDGALRLVYQPVVDLDSGRVRGVEALVRWDDPELGPVPPGEFVPVAEQSELVCELDAWVLRQAATQAVRWLEAGIDLDHVAVNLSARNFGEAGLVERIAATLADVGCPPERIMVEVTESLLVDGLGPGSVGRLLDLGVSVAIDDFGVGFSSLSQLKRVPVTFLKVDRSFVDGLLTDATDTAIVRSTLALARELGKRTIAEGVETIEQLHELHRLGCGSVQGYLLGRPSDAATVTRWLTDGLERGVAALLTHEGSPPAG